MVEFPNFEKEHNEKETKRANQKSIEVTKEQKIANDLAIKTYESSIATADANVIEANRKLVDSTARDLNKAILKDIDPEIKDEAIDAFNEDISTIRGSSLEETMAKQDAFKKAHPEAFEKISKVFYDKNRSIKETLLPELSNETKTAIEDAEVKADALSDPVTAPESVVSDFEDSVRNLHDSLEKRDADLLKKLEAQDPKSKRYIIKTLCLISLSITAGGFLYFFLKLTHNDLSGCFQFNVDSDKKATRTKMDCPDIDANQGSCGCQDADFTVATKNVWCETHKQFPMCCGGGGNPICRGEAGSPNSLYYGASEESIPGDLANAGKALEDAILAVAGGIFKYIIYIVIIVVVLAILYFIFSKLLK